MRLATDTGGTFTDLAVEGDDGSVRLYKASTVANDPVKGVLDAVALAAHDHGMPLDLFLGRARTFIHGTTHALNALIERRVARTALLVTEGHRDILLLREGGRADPFNHDLAFPQPIVPRALTFGVPERILADGRILIPLDEAAVEAIIERLRAEAVEAVAVSLLWSILNPVHERRVGELLALGLPGVPLTLGHVLNPTPREYRRTNSAAINAALRPLMSRYIAGLDDRLAVAGFRGRVLVLTSGGGLVDAADVAETPVRILNSGPSVAPLAGRHYARAEGAETAIIADTGGTTYDVALVRGDHIPVTSEMWLGQPLNGHIVGFPAVDVRSVGAGGGSIAWVDEGGLLRVGPQSAGAAPGPVCYGRGGIHPTVTDAALALGFIDPAFFLGGAIQLDRAAAEAAIMTYVGEPLRLGLDAAAGAIIEVVTENMAQAIQDVALSQGCDPATAVLVGGGGAAGLNSVFIARRLGIGRLLIPETGATLSAAGALLSDLKADFGAVVFATTRRPDWTAVDCAVAALQARCAAFAAGPGAGALSVQTSIVAEARYENQAWAIDVAVDEGLAAPGAIDRFRQQFHATHRELFTIEDPGAEVEIVALRATVGCRMAAADRPFRMAAEQLSAGAPRKVAFPRHARGLVPVHAICQLPIGQEIEGPAILESSFTSIVIDPPARFVRQPTGSILVIP